MIFSRANAAILLSAALLAISANATTTHHSTASTHSSKLTSSHTVSSHARNGSTHAGKKSTSARGHKVHGQQAIAPERVTEIQTALIGQHYLSKDADGSWDTTTQAAMQKYQADHGWQTKLMPDSRAIKALGLGPDYSNAINAKDSSFGPPPPITTIPSSVAAGFAEGSGVVH